MAKEKQPKPFLIETNGHQLALTPGVVMSVLFRKNCEVDYLAVDLDTFPQINDGEGVLRIFNNEDLARWTAGIAFDPTATGRLRTYVPEIKGKAFREEYGWNSGVIIRENPTETEKQWFTEVQVDALDKEWAEFKDE